MAKVKERAGVTGVRNRRTARGQAAKGKRHGKPKAPAPVVRVAVKRLDPVAKCGAGTSVQSLYRVDETVDGKSSTHLVFFDRHGWYCEHGRTCPAVAHVKKRGQLVRVS